MERTNIIMWRINGTWSLVSYPGDGYVYQLGTGAQLGRARISDVDTMGRTYRASTEALSEEAAAIADRKGIPAHKPRTMAEAA